MSSLIIYSAAILLQTLAILSAAVAGVAIHAENKGTDLLWLGIAGALSLFALALVGVAK